MSATTETLQRWICESAATSTTPRKGTRTAGSRPARPSRRSPTPGSAPSAGRASATSRCTRTSRDAGRDGTGGGGLGGAAGARCRAGVAPLRCDAGGEPSLPVVAAEGVRLRLADGRELIDGMASWWCAIHGYRHPALDGARHRAAREDGARDVRRAHARARRAPGRAPVELAPEGLERVFLADSGSVSVEVAIKMCLQYQRSLGHGGRTRLLTVRGGYHGDTTGAMAVCDPLDGMHSLFAGALPEHVFAARPPDGFDARTGRGLGGRGARARARSTRGELAAVIVEPVVQGAGGMRFHSPDMPRAAAFGLRRARAAARVR